MVAEARDQLRCGKAHVGVVGKRTHQGDLARVRRRDALPDRRVEMPSSRPWPFKESYPRETGPAATQSARRLLDAAGFGYTLNIAMGHPADTIVNEAKRFGCEMIVMGTWSDKSNANCRLFTQGWCD